MNRLQSLTTVFCPVCATGRELPILKLPWLKIFGASLVWAGLCGGPLALFVGWGAGLWVALLSGVLSFIILEVYYSVKFKRELVCPVCHFDPVLYRRSPEQAKQQCLQSLKIREESFRSKWQALRKPTAYEGNT